MMPGPPMMRPPTNPMMVPSRPGMALPDRQMRGAPQLYTSCSSSPGDPGAATLAVFKQNDKEDSLRLPTKERIVSEGNSRTKIRSNFHLCCRM